MVGSMDILDIWISGWMGWLVGIGRGGWGDR